MYEGYEGMTVYRLAGLTGEVAPERHIFGAMSDQTAITHAADIVRSNGYTTATLAMVDVPESYPTQPVNYRHVWAHHSATWKEVATV